MSLVGEVLGVFETIASTLKYPLYVKGGALRCILKGKELPDGMDIDLVIPLPRPSLFDKNRSDDGERLEEALNILEMTGTLTRVHLTDDDIPYEGMRFYRFQYNRVGENKSVQVDLMLDEPNSDTIANMLRGKVEGNRVVSINSVQPNRFLDAHHDTMHEILRVNRAVISDMCLSPFKRYHIWRRVVHYLKKGWKYERLENETALPEWFARYRPEIREEQKMCPLTHTNLKEVDWVSQPPCGHSFEAEAYVAYCIKNTSSEEPVFPRDYTFRVSNIGVKCPVCGVREPLQE